MAAVKAKRAVKRPLTTRDVEVVIDGDPTDVTARAPQETVELFVKLPRALPPQYLRSPSHHVGAHRGSKSVAAAPYGDCAMTAVSVGSTGATSCPVGPQRAGVTTPLLGGRGRVVTGTTNQTAV